MESTKPPALPPRIITRAVSAEVSAAASAAAPAVAPAPVPEVRSVLARSHSDAQRMAELAELAGSQGGDEATMPLLAIYDPGELWQHVEKLFEVCVP